MAKNKNKSGLSIADIICTLGFLTLLFFLFCGFCYDGKGMQMSILMTLGIGVLMLLALVIAIYLKKTKPYNKAAWRIAEYSAVLVFLAISALIIAPIGKFVASEWVESSAIERALDKDRENVTQQITTFKKEKGEHLDITVQGLDNFRKDLTNNSKASANMDKFITDHVPNCSGASYLNRGQIDAYRQLEQDALREMPNKIEYYKSDNDYRAANFFTRAQKASEHNENFHNVYFVLSNYHNRHPYNNFSKRSYTGYYDMNDEDDVSLRSSDFRKSNFERAIENVSPYNPTAVVIVVVLLLFILLPYIVTMRQHLVRTVDRSGKDVGGRPLILN